MKKIIISDSDKETKQEVFHAASLRNGLEEIFLANTDKKILLITYKNFQVDLPSLTKNIIHIHFATKLLTFKAIENFIQTLKAQSIFPDVIIGIGGGVVLDLAKMVRFEFNKDFKRAELILIPSSAGSGSESTRYAVVYDENKIKHSMEDKVLSADIVIHAPELLLTVPRLYRISSGFDAFAQAMESLWSCHSTDQSKKYAYEALTLIKDYFVSHVNTQNTEAAMGMQRAAYLSGKAINISYTTLAHALSYPLTSKFGIPHGIAVFLFIPQLISYNAEIPEEELNDIRGVQHCSGVLSELQNLFQVNSFEELGQICYSYFELFKISGNLEDYGVFPEDVDYILQEASRSTRGQNNPRKLNTEVFKKLLNSHFCASNAVVYQQTRDELSMNLYSLA